MSDDRPHCPNHRIPVRTLRGNSVSYMDEDLDEPGVGKPFSNAIERMLYLNCSCPRGDSSASVEIKRAVYSNPEITDVSPSPDLGLIFDGFKPTNGLKLGPMLLLTIHGIRKRETFVLQSV